MSPWLLAAPLAVAMLATAFLWRKTLTLQESFENTQRLLTEARAELQARVAAIPELVTAALDTAIANYVAGLPPSGELDGVTRESLIAGMQSISDDARAILNNAEVIPLHIHDAQPTPREG